MPPKNFYDYLFTPEKETPAESVVQDEAIGQWTHKFVVYCNNPKKDFENELKSMDGVVAVFGKSKADTSPQK